MRSSTAPAGGPGSPRATYHQLRHTCLTQLCKAGMSLEVVQAQAGHASMSPPASTCTWAMTGWPQYRRAAEAIDTQALAVTALPGAR